jgi:hypothetical protein
MAEYYREVLHNRRARLDKCPQDEELKSVLDRFVVDCLETEKNPLGLIFQKVHVFQCIKNFVDDQFPPTRNLLRRCEGGERMISSSTRLKFQTRSTLGQCY